MPTAVRSACVLLDLQRYAELVSVLLAKNFATRLSSHVVYSAIKRLLGVHHNTSL
jgi:hypothetical protein